MRFVGDLTTNFLRGAQEQKLRNFTDSDLEQVTAKLLEEFQTVKDGRKHSIKFTSGLP